jgi:hypothetical protein
MISEEYKNILKTLYQKRTFTEKNFWYDDFKKFLSDEIKPNSILDFGCSHGASLKKIKEDFSYIQKIHGYDPGVEEYEEKPKHVYEYLLCTDVIEHIEPEYLEETLSYIDSLFTRKAWVIIACYPAKKKLLDGRNAHLIIEDSEWWIQTFNKNMLSSKIISIEKIVKNPDNPIIDKKDRSILIPPGQQIELRLILGKNGKS